MLPEALTGRSDGLDTGRTYVNPLTYVDGAVPTNPDPFVLRFRARYWCYSTDESGVNVSTSPDLVEWRHLGHALEVAGQRQFWAPCVVYADGLFWMYFSSRPAGSDDPHDEVLQVATSTRPEGPFEVRRRLFDTFSIDPHVVRDPATGGYVMFYSTNETTGLDVHGTGTSIVVDRMASMEHLAGSPRPVVVPTLEQEIFERDRFGDGRDWYTVEGGSYFTRRGRAYLTYSGNAYVGENYFIGYAHAELDGPPDELRWSKFPSDFEWSPLVRRNHAVEGTGHNSIVRAPNLVDDWIVYHGRDASVPLDQEREQRVMRIDPLYYDGGRLLTPAPTTDPQDAPAAATVRDDFDGAGLGSHWTRIAGDFITESSSVDQGLVSTGRDQMSLMVHDLPVTHYVCEVDVRAVRSDAGARFGVAPLFHDVDNYVAVLLDTATGTIEMRSVQEGMAREIARSDLASFNPATWHLIRIERTYSEVTVQMDGFELLSANVGDDTAATVGLLSIGTRASFSSFVLTDHLDLHGERLAYLPKLLRANRGVDLTAAGVVATARRPVVLEGRAGSVGVVITYEVELLGPHGRCDVQPVVLDDNSCLSIEITAFTVRICVKRAGNESHVTHVPNDRRRVSIRTTVDHATTVVRVGAHTSVVPLRLGKGFTQRIELSASALRGFEMTSIS